MLHRFALIAAAVVLVTTPALADGAPSRSMSDSGFILSAERMFGLNYTRLNSEGTYYNLFTATALWNAPPSVQGALPNPATIPRLAGDFMVSPNLTFGAAVGVTFANFGREGRDAVQQFGLLAAPRVGYLFALGESSKLWLRGGITFMRANIAANNDDLAWNHLSFTLEPVFVLPLTTSAAFTITPLVEFPLVGRLSEDGRDSSKLAALTFGANGGLLAHF